MIQKVVIEGLICAGKTTLRKFFFKGKNSVKLLKNKINLSISIKYIKFNRNDK